MKKKIVIKVSMNDEKSRCKALQISVGMSGVESAALRGQEKDQLEVIGEDIDVVVLTRRLRKKMCHADVVSVGEVKKEQPAAKEAKPPALSRRWFGPTRHRVTDTDTPYTQFVK